MSGVNSVADASQTVCPVVRDDQLYERESAAGRDIDDGILSPRDRTQLCSIRQGECHTCDSRPYPKRPAIHQCRSGPWHTHRKHDHRPIDRISSHDSTGRARFPQTDSHRVSVQHAKGEIVAGHPPQWIMSTMNDAVVVAWQIYSFGDMFVFAYQRCISQLRSEGGRHRDAILSDAQKLLHFAVAFLDAMDITESNFLPFRQSNRVPGRQKSLVEETVFLMNVFQKEGHSISQVLLLLRHFCRFSPTEVFTALQESPLLSASRSPAHQIQEILSLSTSGSVLESFHRAHAMIALLTEFVRQKHLFDELSLCLTTICDKLLPTLKHPCDETAQKTQIVLFGSVIAFLHQIFLLGAEEQLTQKLIAQIREGFCIEDTVRGVLKLMPRRLADVLHYQAHLVTTLCTFLTDILSETTHLKSDLVQKIVHSLLTRGYWDSQSPAAQLAFFISKAQEVEAASVSDVECSSAALRFFSALLHQFETHKATLKSFRLIDALPLDGSHVHPSFRRSVLLISYYQGRPMDIQVIHATMDLLVTACMHDSEFIPFLIYPSTLVPDCDNKVPSLLDMSWRVVSNHPRMFREQPALLCSALKGMRAIQTSSESRGKQAWEILRGQNGFYDALLEIGMKNRQETGDQGDLREIDRFRKVHEHNQALALEILSVEIQCAIPDARRKPMLLSILDARWNTWSDLLRDACYAERDEGLATGVDVSANSMAYEMMAAMGPQGPAYGISMPWTTALEEVHPALDRDPKQDTHTWTAVGCG